MGNKSRKLKATDKSDSKKELDENVKFETKIELKETDEHKPFPDVKTKSQSCTSLHNADLVVSLTKLVAKAGDLKKDLERIIENLTIGNDAMKIIFEIEDANKFIDGLLTEVKESEKYFAKGIAWHIRAKIRKAQGEVKWLSIFLVATVDPEITKWSVKLSIFDMSIFNLKAINPDKTQKRVNKELNNDQPRWGYPKFITIDELKNDGFIKDDKIKIEVHIKVDAVTLSSQDEVLENC